MASPRRRALLASAALAVVAGLGLGVPSATAAPVDLVGTFTIAPGACTGGKTGTGTGSYFRMILPSGNQSGPFIDNTDSTCANPTYTLFTPGADGGLVTGGYQPAPSPGFDGDGNSTANRIIQPVKFFGRNFSLSTNPTDLQIGQAVSAPVLRADGNTITGDVTALNATWNRQAFNQGSPKPGGSLPGNTKVVSGTYDAASGRYSLTWSSQIVGGPFDNFTGQWHLEGTFRPAGSGGATPAPAASGATPTPAASGVAGTVPVADDTGATSTTAATALAGGEALDGEQAAALTTVTDNGFQAPAGIVILLAVLGIAGVVVLVLLRPTGEGTTSA
jgi:hypothetical protein